MAISKTLILVGLSFALVLLISSEVSARELVETTPIKGIYVKGSLNGKKGSVDGGVIGGNGKGMGKGGKKGGKFKGKAEKSNKGNKKKEG
ncbi:hypothetical protein M5689_010025 [Euphorbia peplus]|nr:hypothetical protein M5689_010025 [Euphorbia peplus]